MAFHEDFTARRNRDDGADEAHSLIEAHLLLVRKIAGIVYRKCGMRVEYDELAACGMVALVEAALNYADQGHGFATYATLRIRGAMIDELRRQSRMTRAALRWNRNMAEARTMLCQQLHREPCSSELAQAMGITAQELRRQVDDCHQSTLVSLESSYDDRTCDFADRSRPVDAAISGRQYDMHVFKEIADLPERERVVIERFFFAEENLEQIGKHMDIGAARVCQIKKAGLDRLRRRMGGAND